MTRRPDVLGPLWRMPDADAVAEAAAGFLSSRIARAVDERGFCHLMLAGGETPDAAYRRLATVPGVPWERVQIWFGDERAVPPQDPQSNYQRIMDALAGPAGLDLLSVHRMEADDPDLEVAAARYAAVLPERIDVLVLGVGEDGHTASLFPGSPALGAVRRVVPVLDAPKPPERRLTITPSVIGSARKVMVLAKGRGKAAALRAAIQGPWDPAVCPAQLALGGTWIADEEALSEIRTEAEAETETE